MAKDVVRIGGACAGWGDGNMAIPQLVQAEMPGGGGVDYLILDFLSEYFLPVMGRMRKADPRLGYALSFAGELMRPSLREIAARGIKVVTNAGGANPAACAAAFAAIAAAEGLSFRIAWIDGDDLSEQGSRLAAVGVREMTTGAPWPDRPLTGLQAYLGAAPIARALAQGADIVITGRVVDSALALGPLMHEFGWAADDHDRLAAGSVIGHLLECGAQATGGLFTDWEEVTWADIGYPVAECRPDGSAVITKPPGTGGLVSVGTVAEQLLYEVGDPAGYILPDVIVDMTQVQLRQEGPDRVHVSGARGRPPTGLLKASACWDDGWRATIAIPLRGPRAAAKGRHMADELLRRIAGMLTARDMAPLSRTHREMIGGEESYGAQGRQGDAREIVCRVAVEHEDRAGVELFLQESATTAIAMAPGNAGSMLGTTLTEVGRVFSFLLPRDAVTATLHLDGQAEPVPFGPVAAPHPAPALPAAPLPAGPADGGTVPLLSLAWVRNGDKGDIANIAVIARRPEFLPWIAAALTEEAVRGWYRHWLREGDAGRVERFHAAGIHALNFLLHDALDGGCTSSLRFDPLGKSIAQELLDFPVPVSRAVAAAI